MYTYNIEQLVQCGFIVLAIGSTHESIFTIFPDGAFVQQLEAASNLESTDFSGWQALLDVRVKDISYVLSQLEEWNQHDALLRGGLDLHRIGIIGHSLGGAAALHAAKAHSQVKAGAMLDASFHLLDIQEGERIDTPFLVLRQEKTTFDELNGIMSEAILSPFLQRYQRLCAALDGSGSFASIKGAHHMTFCDVPLHFNEAGIEEKHRTINRHVCDFFERFLTKSRL